MIEQTIEPWLHVFSIWYAISTAYTLRKLVYGGVLVAVLGTWGFLSDIWTHLSVYIYWDPAGTEIPLPKVIFLAPFAFAFLHLYYQLCANTYATNLTKILLALFFIVGNVTFTPADDSLKDIYWHYNHSVLHVISAVTVGVVAQHLDELRMIKEKIN
ncbi:hypothetical protein LOD99_15316 [Oopsacas minuta]|uniref:Post-GPI attachment to proteins factor 3 n=1 Tax=Oopsacas minuta TaxID=111878 RepID=A0AAV7KBR8_9METZ|nr:hypothetical protein LOD99_15316 [Oopsacas minuta]